MAVNNLVNITIQAIDKVKDPLNKMTGSFTSFGARVKAVGDNLGGLSTKSSIAFAGITFGINSTLNASNDLQASLIGLQSVAEGMGQDFNKAKKFLQSYTADGLVSMGESATALKNLLSRGFGLEEASQMMLRFKDSASFGRQSALSMGEAIKGATEGIKNENSVLVDNAGVTKNVSMMWGEYADKLGKSVNDLTLAEKRQAEYNGIMEETKFQVGDAGKLTDTYAGKQAILNAQLLQAKQQIGEALQPAMAKLLETVTPIIEKVREWVTEHPKLTSNIVLGTTALLGLGAVLAPLIITIGSIITVVGSLGTALLFLVANPIGIVITAIAGLIAAGVALYTNWDQVKLNLGGSLYLMLEDMKLKMGEMKDSVIQIGSDIKWGFLGWIDALVQGLKDKMEAVMNYVKEKVQKAKALMSSIAGELKTSITNVGANVKTVLGVDGTRAVGGPVSGGSTYLVGENGPELFSPLGGGYITPNNQLGGGIGVNINLGNVQIFNSQDETRLISKIKEELIRTIQLQKMGIST